MDVPFEPMAELLAMQLEFLKRHLAVPILVEELEVFLSFVGMIVADRACLKFLEAERTVAVGVELGEGFIRSGRLVRRGGLAWRGRVMWGRRLVLSERDRSGESQRADGGDEWFHGGLSEYSNTEDRLAP